MTDVITEHIDIWTSAITTKKSVGRGSSKKQEAYGIKKLRELILELAVRGKLVAQDPEDEPASVLLDKIAEEKENLIADGTHKKQKKLSEISDDEKLYMLSDSWQWARLGNIGETNIGLTYSPKNIGDKGTPVLRSTNVQKRKIVLSDLVRVDMKIKESAYVGNGDLLICARNGSKALVGKTAMIKDLKEPMAFGAFMAIFRSPINEYVEIFLNSPIYRRNLDGTSTTTINQITQTNLKETLIPIPPLAEQHRIVAKVDELMALCDKLEEEQEENGATHQILVETLLNTLTDVETPEAFTQSWQRIAGHFDVLFTTEKSIDKLQETILQLAVMGKLVAQDPDDEPASVLFEKIVLEREQLIKDKKIKKLKKFKDIQENEKPFFLPDNWEFVRLNDIGEWGAGATPTRGNPKYYGGTIPWFKSGELSADYISKSEEHITELALAESSVRYNKVGDVLMAMYGATIGKTSILEIPATTNQAVCACTPFSGFENIFLLVLLKAYKQRFINMGAGGAQPNISREKIIATIIPLPPRDEQLRIVGKVYALMELCDKLRASLRELQTTQINLADTVAKQLAK